MDKIIKVDSATREKICKAFRVTTANVGQALAFKRNSKKCVAMRAMALENGGILYEQVKKIIQ